MKAPMYLLKTCLKVITNEVLIPPQGMFVCPRYLEDRRPRTKGTIIGYVPGHGGDVYWVRHKDGKVGAYSYPEFERQKKKKSTGVKK